MDLRRAALLACALLISVAPSIAATAPPSDIIWRFGGELGWHNEQSELVVPEGYGWASTGFMCRLTPLLASYAALVGDDGRSVTFRCDSLGASVGGSALGPGHYSITVVHAAADTPLLPEPASEFFAIWRPITT